MSSLHEAAQLALEALELRCGTNAEERQPNGAITLLKAALRSEETGTPSSEQETPHHDGPLCYGTFKRLLIVPNTGTADNPVPNKHYPIADLGNPMVNDDWNSYDAESYGNARRLVACWNACLGVPLTVLEDMQHGAISQMMTPLTDMQIAEVVIDATNGRSTGVRFKTLLKIARAVEHASKHKHSYTFLGENNV